MTFSRRLVVLALLCAGLACSPVLLAPVQADAPTGPRTVPDVVGLPLVEAKRMLADASFEVAIEAVPSTAAKPGIVLAQDPGGRTTREAGSKVTIQVAAEPAAAAPTPEPAPAPQPPAEPAQPAPAPSNPDTPPTGELPALPTETTPAAPVQPDEVPLEPPAEVPAPMPPPALADLPLEPGVDTQGAALPNALGMTRVEAERALAGWQVLMEVTLSSPAMKGRVVEQFPLPGSTLAAGQSVTLVFGLAEEPGPDYGQVPSVEGLALADAHARILRAGYKPVYASVPSLEAQAGSVVATQPRRHSFLLRGEQLRVHVGRGGLAAPSAASEPEPVAVLPPAAEPPAPTDAPPSGPLEPTAPLPEPSPAVPTEPPPAEPAVPAGPTVPAEPAAPVEPAAPAEPTPVEPAPATPSEPAPAEPAAPAAPVEPTAPAEPAPVEPAPATPSEPTPAEPAPMPFPTAPALPPPPATQLVLPIEGDSFPKAYGPAFEWDPVRDADGYEWEVEAETTDNVWRAVRTERLTGSKFRPARMEAGRYRWRVRALRGEATGEWTPWRRLYLY